VRRHRVAREQWQVLERFAQPSEFDVLASAIRTVFAMTRHPF
jgi:hypothetical protein